MHPQRHDAPRARVGWPLARRCRSGQKEARLLRPVVDMAADQVPRRRVPLPFVDQHRRIALYQPRRVAQHQLELLIVVETMHRAGAAQRRLGLADRPRPPRARSRAGPTAVRRASGRRCGECTGLGESRPRDTSLSFRRLVFAYFDALCLPISTPCICLFRRSGWRYRPPGPGSQMPSNLSGVSGPVPSEFDLATTAM